MTWVFPHATQPSQKKTLCTKTLCRHVFLDLQYCVNKIIFLSLANFTQCLKKIGLAASLLVLFKKKGQREEMRKIHS